VLNWELVTKCISNQEGGKWTKVIIVARYSPSGNSTQSLTNTQKVKPVAMAESGFCDPCADFECHNGTCEMVGGEAKCVCETGFIGTTCKYGDWCNPNPCENGGTCHWRSCTGENDGICDWLLPSYDCYCIDGWTGKDCNNAPTTTTTEAPTEAPTTAVAPSSFANSPVRSDNTIRPFIDQTKCFYHKMNGFTEKELIYVSTCVDHDRYRWGYDESTGLIQNWNRKSVGTGHCIEIPEARNIPEARKKQQLFLAPCDDTNPAQSWIVQDGMLRVRSTPSICVMWNFGDGTRLWSIPCGEHLFAPMV